MLAPLRIVLIAAALSGCTVPGSTPNKEPTPDPKPVERPQTLVTVSSHGGLCPDGRECSTHLVIKRSGKWEASGYARDFGPGDLPPAMLATLIREADAAVKADLVTKPFTGDCPTAFDGQEQTIQVHRADGDIVISSCTDAFRDDAKLLAAISDAMKEIDKARWSR